MVKDQFWEHELSLNALIPSEITDKEDNHQYLILFDDHPKEEGILVSSRFVLRMRIERGGVVLQADV